MSDQALRGDRHYYKDLEIVDADRRLFESNQEVECIFFYSQNIYIISWSIHDAMWNFQTSDEKYLCQNTNLLIYKLLLLSTTTTTMTTIMMLMMMMMLLVVVVVVVMVVVIIIIINLSDVYYIPSRPISVAN